MVILNKLFDPRDNSYKFSNNSMLEFLDVVLGTVSTEEEIRSVLLSSISLIQEINYCEEDVENVKMNT